MDVHILAARGRGLHARLRSFFDAPVDASATPLEIVQAVLDDVERHVEPIGRGRRVFPYTRLHVHVRATDADAARVEAVFADVTERVRVRLTEVRCDAPETLDVVVGVVAEPPATWTPAQVFAVDYLRLPAAHAAAGAPAGTRAGDSGRPDGALRPGDREVPPTERTTPAGGVPTGRELDAVPRSAGPVRAAAMPRVVVTVLHGTAVDRTVTCSGTTVAIGRGADATDDGGRVRRNAIAFTDVVDGVNETVGRAHACLRYVAATAEYRLFDEGSRNGTSILRGGEVIAVPPRDPRGVRVRSADEIQVGRARLRVDIET